VENFEEERETPQAIGSSGVARRLVMGKRSERRSGGRCEPLIKRLKLSAFRNREYKGQQRGTLDRWNPEKIGAVRSSKA
jgi:hypothetical protein